MIHLTLEERKVFLFLSFLIILGLCVCVFSKLRGCPVSLYTNKTEFHALDINKATRQELISLPAIGEKTADAIIAYRLSRNGFKNLEELREIKGITEAKLERLKKYMKVE